MPLEPTPDPSDATLAPRPAAPRTFASGRYAVVRVLGEGGQKVVYMVHDSVLDRDCALSMVRSALLDPEDLERLKREAQAMARLGSQPNVVTVFDFGDEDGAPYLVCEYVAGGDLRRELNAAAGPLSLWRAISIASDVAQALEAAHARGVIHRDLKPGNIWLGDHGSAKLGDFGLAFSLDRSRLTMPGTVMGTAAYLSPEQALGEPVTERSDLYALGCLLFEMVCGKPPFVDTNPTVVISQHINAVPAAPSSHRHDVPAALEDLILRLLAKSPARRPESAAAVLEELRRIGHSFPDSPSWRAASLQLAPRRARIPFLGRLRPAAAYDLTVRNDSDELIDFQLTAKTTTIRAGSTSLIGCLCCPTRRRRPLSEPSRESGVGAAQARRMCSPCTVQWAAENRQRPYRGSMRTSLPAGCLRQAGSRCSALPAPLSRRSQSRERLVRAVSNQPTTTSNWRHSRLASSSRHRTSSRTWARRT